MPTVKALDPEPAKSDNEAKLVLLEGIIVACDDPALLICQCERKDLLGRSLLDFSTRTQPNGRSSADALRLRTAAALAFQQQHFHWVCKRNNDKTFKAQALLERIQARGKTFVQLSLSRIKEHDPTEEALLKFRMGIERSNDAIFMTNVDGNIIYVNPAFERTYGYSSDEVLGKTPRLLKSGEIPQGVYKEFWQILLNKEVVAGEIVNKTKDGRLVHIEGSNNPIVDESGNLIGFLSIHRDITERKQAEEALQEAHEQLEKRVEERTAELERVNALLTKQYQELVDAKLAFERRNLILEALNEITRQTSSSLELQPIFETLIQVTGRLLDCTSAYVSSVDLERKTMSVVAEYISPNALESEQVSDLGTIYDLEEEFGESPASILASREVTVVNVDDPNISEKTRAHMARYGAITMLEILLVVDGEPVAEVEFWESRHKRAFTSDEIDLVRAVTRQVAIPIQNARLYQRAILEIEERQQLELQIQESYERRGRQVQLSAEFARDIAATTDLSDLYQLVVNQVKEQFDYYYTQLLRYEPTLDSMVLIAGYGDVGERMLRNGHTLPMGEGLIGKAAVTGRSVLRSNVAEDPEWQANTQLPDTKGELAVPIMLGDEVLGVLDVWSDVAGALNADDQLALEGLCGQIAIAIESTRLRQEMEDRLRELNHLQRIMSKEGWQVYRSKQAAGTLGYRYDWSAVQRVSSVRAATSGDSLAASIWDTQPLAELPKKVVTHAMEVRGEVIGALGIRDDPDHPLTTEDRELLDSISVQVAEALESARLLEETKKHAIQMEAVAEVSAAASSILDSERLLQIVTRLTKDRFGLYRVAVYFKSGDMLRLARSASTQQLVGESVLPEIHILQAQSIVARAARSLKPIYDNNVDSSGPGPQSNIGSELAIPMIVGDQLIGVLDLRDERPGRFSEDEVAIQLTLATQIAVALQNARLYAEQLAAAERLREVDRLKSEFLASMSHELRTPLNSIIGFADVLLEGIDGPLNDRMEQDVTLIRDSGRHLRSLIGEILDMSKIEAGVMQLFYEEIDLPVLAEEIVATTRSLAKDKDLKIQMRVDTELSSIEADRTRLIQILLNLMGNAVKFTEEGKITLRFEEQNGDLLASVQDTGIGISEEDLPTIFEQFRQIDGSLTREAGGTGLGIPISKSLVELHGGTMWVQSDPLVGSTFSFTIPKRRPAEKQKI